MNTPEQSPELSGAIACVSNLLTQVKAHADEANFHATSAEINAAHAWRNCQIREDRRAMGIKESAADLTAYANAARKAADAAAAQSQAAFDNWQDCQKLADEMLETLRPFLHTDNAMDLINLHVCAVQHTKLSKRAWWLAEQKAEAAADSAAAIESAAAHACPEPPAA